MTDLENYSNIVESIFGSHAVSFKIINDSTNNVIGALNNTSHFEDFALNFTERLKRLKEIYSLRPDYLKKILVQVNGIASEKNWAGSFAELAAYDYLNNDVLKRKTYLFNPIKPDVTIDKSMSLSLELGKESTNLDGLIEDFGIYFDVKCLKDNITEIFDGIYSDFQKQTGNKHVMIGAEYQSEMHYQIFEKNRQKLLNELKAGLSASKKETYLQSKVIKDLTYRIVWGAGVLTTQSSYDAYRHACNYYKTIFNYANKFVKDNPTLIVLVKFPWYNQRGGNLSNVNAEFYRALARRFFCQHRNDTAKFSSLAPSFAGSKSIFEVSKYLSGIVFLEDNTILSEKPNEVNVKSYVYLNPNAVNPLSKSFSTRQFIMGLRNMEYDDFEFDNY